MFLGLFFAYNVYFVVLYKFFGVELVGWLVGCLVVWLFVCLLRMMISGVYGWVVAWLLYGKAA